MAMARGVIWSMTRLPDWPFGQAAPWAFKMRPWPSPFRDRSPSRSLNGLVDTSVTTNLVTDPSQILAVKQIERCRPCPSASTRAVTGVFDRNR